MRPIKLRINTNTQKYSIVIGSNIGINISKILRENSINFKKCLLIIDKNISKNFISKIKKSLNKKKLHIHYFKANEMNKNFIGPEELLEDAYRLAWKVFKADFSLHISSGYGEEEHRSQ